MELEVLGSSSQGNCYILTDSKGEILMLEAGVPYREVARRLGRRIAQVKGCVITHEHKDHSKAIADLLKAGIHCYSLRSAFETSNAERAQGWIELPLAYGQLQIGDYTVYHYEAIHDAPCLNYTIYHPDCGFIGFLTDTKECIFDQPQGIRHLLIEANYDEETLQESLETGRTNMEMTHRLRKTHMSLETAQEYIARQKTRGQLQEIILIHLSNNNANQERYIREVQGQTGITTYVATKGAKFNLN